MNSASGSTGLGVGQGRCDWQVRVSRDGGREELSSSRFGTYLWCIYDRVSSMFRLDTGLSADLDGALGSGGRASKPGLSGPTDGGGRILGE